MLSHKKKKHMKGLWCKMHFRCKCRPAHLSVQLAKRQINRPKLIEYSTFSRSMIFDLSSVQVQNCIQSEAAFKKTVSSTYWSIKQFRLTCALPTFIFHYSFNLFVILNHLKSYHHHFSLKSLQAAMMEILKQQKRQKKSKMFLEKEQF